MTALSNSDAIQRSPDCCWPDDDGLRTAALKLLQSSGFAALRRLRCEVTEAVVTVHGVVPSYYLKQIAQTAILRLHGIRSVRNLVEVRQGNHPPPVLVADEAPSCEALDGDPLRTCLVPSGCDDGPVGRMTAEGRSQEVD